MKCYYEELGVERDASENDIKTAYRKLALKWHPDKNPHCMDEAKERFQLIQQAYEVLSDPHERSWYDNHREQILRGKNSDYEDNCLDVFEYFTVSCFKGYGDDDKGFYAVYREVFEKIAAEDSEFMDDEEELENIPKFGDSKSNYEDVVGPFYAYWSAYCTKRTYTWLCPYDIKEIKDRRILRKIEKDMKKIVQKAKKQRNEEVRNLVSFIRKRDKRVQVYKKLLEEKAALNRQKQEQNRLEQIRRRQHELEEMRQNSKIINVRDDDYEEQLKQLEQEYSSDEEYYEEDDGEDEDDEGLIESYQTDPENNDDDDDDYMDDLFCVACNREFKTKKAFSNHETSKKHLDNIESLKLEMQKEDHLFKQDEHFLENEQNATKLSEEDEKDSQNSENILNKNKSSAPTNKKEAKKNKQLLSSDEELNYDENMEEVTKHISKVNLSDNDDDWNNTNKKSSKKLKNKNKLSNNKPQLAATTSIKPQETKSAIANIIKTSSGLQPETQQHICATCKSKFESKNKLFSHLKLTNHGVYIPKPKATNDENTKSKKKGKRK